MLNEQSATLELTFYSLKQAEAFVAEGTSAGERVRKDLEETEIQKWFANPGKCISEITHPPHTMDLMAKEIQAAWSVGAEVKLMIPRGDQ
jgi:hypothetical protein